MAVAVLIEQLSAYDLGWLVGVLEGEGTFYTKRHGPYRYPIIRVKMTDRDTIMKVSALLGVPARGPYGKETVAHQLVYTATVAKQVDATTWMLALRQHMSFRRQGQIDKVLRECE